MIIGSLVGILILVWFYNTANGRNPVQWAFAGFLVYFIVSLLWTVGVTPVIKDAAMHSRNALLMWTARYAYIIVALACTVVFNLKAGYKK